ncbi:CRP/FNR family transcriptional regulator, anaerobic regulatory protein [Seinonella peptonophila]|uniref:CRP/FNR family transcriptional regulator, anaerobic regulatory protein n=1 Tax=Seinonella peptonophila TaxID=112248 RepID=A0A1M4X883_9BACL|nr:Crp/Fnr family transcriptional regulator [Seinonella peptonophila]SHE89699.1 CRP/FNR family transcriptional regulator, anaerobic regulatory protein [Seinonella peptonophila]
MLTDTALSHVIHIFPFLKVLSPREWNDAEPSIQLFPAKTRFFEVQASEIYSMFLLQGKANITVIDKDGTEVVSNTLAAGEVCGLLTLSGLSGRDYPGSIVSITEVKVLFVRKTSFIKWILQYEPIRHAIFGGLLNGMLRMSERKQKQDGESLEKRLVKTLLQWSTEHNSVIYITHLELAKELGTAREVVSRYLQRYRNRNWIQTGRGWIKILQRKQLATLVM